MRLPGGVKFFKTLTEVCESESDIAIFICDLLKVVVLKFLPTGLGTKNTGKISQNLCP